MIATAARRAGRKRPGQNSRERKLSPVSRSNDRRLVWDLPLRLFHWLLVLSLALLWFTQWAGFEHMTEIPATVGLDWMVLHMWLGYWTLGLILFRILWGIVGPRHARFISFFPTPRRVAAYLGRSASGRSAKPVGHNPLGAAMVFLMLALVALQAISGLFASDDIFTYGPYNGAEWLDSGTIAALNAMHHWLFDYILIAIAIHVVAILIYALLQKQNLVGPMIHGRKAASAVPEGQEIGSSALIRAAITVLLSAAIVYAIIAASPPQAASLY